jgi:2'-5' RNA ligase
MLKRVFIAINLPENLKEKLAKFEKNFPELPAKWVKKENLHLTLVFLGYLKDFHLEKVKEVVKEVGKNFSPFFVSLKRVCFGPPKTSPPRLVWVELEKNEVLEDLVKKLQEKLKENKIPFVVEEREFLPHITLARIRKWEFQRMDLEERPRINEIIKESFEVKSIEIMESHLKRSGAEYTPLYSVELGANFKKL